MQKTNLDVKGLMCPLPVLKARKALKALPAGSVLVLEATDPASVIDVAHFCNEQGHTLLDTTEKDGVYFFEIERKQSG